MKKMISVGILTILATISLTGCNAEQAVVPTEQPVVTEDPEVTTPEASLPIVDTEDYDYDSMTGELKSLKDDEVLYRLASHPEMVLHVLGLEGTKLIVWETGNDNSPGPGWVHEIWSSGRVDQYIYYLDLDDLDKGLQPYTIPESKRQAEKILLDDFNNQLRNL